MMQPPPIRSFVAASIGGATGASLRWLIGNTQHLSAGSWPWPTLIVNMAGCLAIGFFASRLNPGTLRWDAIVTGLLGGFTTMSSFAVELNAMVDLDRGSTAVAYGAVTLIGGAAAVGITYRPTKRRSA